MSREILGSICLHAGKGMHISTATGDIKIQGGPNVVINDAKMGEPVHVATIVAAKNPAGPAPGSPGTKPFIPTGGGSIDKPMGVDDVELQPPPAGLGE